MRTCAASFGFYVFNSLWQATDDNSAESPFSDYRIGQTLTARIVSKGIKLENIRGCFELSIKPTFLEGKQCFSSEVVKIMTGDGDKHYFLKPLLEFILSCIIDAEKLFFFFYMKNSEV